MNRIRMTVIAVALVGAGACTTTTEPTHERGQAVREMIRAQTYDARTLTNPSGVPVEGADPDMVNAAINVFRENVSRPEEIGRPITIELGED